MLIQVEKLEKVLNPIVLFRICEYKALIIVKCLLTVSQTHLFALGWFMYLLEHLCQQTPHYSTGKRWGGLFSTPVFFFAELKFSGTLILVQGIMFSKLLCSRILVCILRFLCQKQNLCSKMVVWKKSTESTWRYNNSVRLKMMNMLCPCPVRKCIAATWILSKVRWRYKL